ncbi:unnamed protein product [Allacma fusca]|uniref:PWWP domain-containing protein n=1 Tax=Allacma fusca TaxID=39272 RepID=A0A8J2PYY5_9HEXA|nr:unnamed protein product [Allacma fusca]
MVEKDKFKMGDRVFGKMQGWSPWPGLVLQRCITKVEKYEVFFYGSHDVADLKPAMMYPYTEENIVKYNSTGKFYPRFKEAMDEIQADVNSITTAEGIWNGHMKTALLDLTANRTVSGSNENETISGSNENDTAFGTNGNGAVSGVNENGEVLKSCENDTVPEVAENDAEKMEETDNDSDARPMLFEMQHEPKKSSDVDCTFRCYDGEILVHAALLRNWLAENSQSVLPKNLEFDLKIWTISELAPIVILMYTIQPVMKLNVRAKQAFKKIQQYLSKTGFNINIPEIADPVEPLDLKLKFRCTKISPRSGRKSSYYVVSSDTFLDACDECKFSGLAGDLKKHYRDTHGMTDPSLKRNEQLPRPQACFIMKLEAKEIIGNSGEFERQTSASKPSSTTKTPDDSVIASLCPLVPPDDFRTSNKNKSTVVPVPTKQNSLGKLSRHCDPIEDSIVPPKKPKIY